ncbi:MAG: sporulation integral membrane protein YtvI [Oscillospiraceae bacterium]|jgi:sporulation integral membrane protein YtvI|nr:sporulation integral membrane protein YtvI [Oscillospiraceae bacterium]
MENEKTAKRRAFLINAAFICTVVLIVYIAFKYVVVWLLPFVLGFIIASIFHPIIRWMNKKIKIQQKFLAVLVIVIGYVVLITILTFATIQLVLQLSDWLPRLPSYFTSDILPTFNNLSEWLGHLISGFPPEWNEFLVTFETNLISTINDFVVSLSTRGVSFIGNLTKGFPAFFIALIFTIMSSFFISMQYDKIKDFASYQMPEKMRNIVREIKNTFSGTILKYLKAYLKIMCLTFFELSLALLVLRVKNAIPVAFLIALFDILPVFGTGGILVPWAAISLLRGDYMFSVGILIAYMIITIVRNFVEPKIIGDQLGLNPLISLISIYLGFVWIGVFGMILMPVSVQIALTLHNRGVITLFKRREAPASEELERANRRDKPTAGK